MEKILFLAHTETDGSLAKNALEALSGAKTAAASFAGATLIIGLFGENVAGAAAQIAGAGATTILGVSGPDFSQARYATDAAAVEALARKTEATVVFAPATARLNRVLPGVAFRLNGRADTHATGLASTASGLIVHRWYYRRRMEAKMRRTQRPWFISVDAGSLPAWEGPSAPAAVENVTVALNDDRKRTRVEGVKAPPADEQTIRPDAELLFVAGAGWTKKQADGKVHLEDAQKQILEFLRLAKASLGGSKSMVDLSGEGQATLSFMTHLNQVGQTGSTPRHPKGLSACCHGEEPHVVGWRFVNERRVINLDPNCGWAHGKADVLYVADAFAVMAKVNELLAQA
jgi:electron transfer flavoprotein alpha subunit